MVCVNLYSSVVTILRSRRAGSDIVPLGLADCPITLEGVSFVFKAKEVLQ
jgi:hypothetical protein